MTTNVTDKIHTVGLCSFRLKLYKHFFLILQHDNCGGHEAAGVVCDTSTNTNEILEYREEAEVRIVPAEEEESYNDNCSLTIPLYFPLRLSETYYKR